MGRESNIINTISILEEILILKTGVVMLQDNV